MGVTDRGDGVSQSTLPARLEYNIKVDSGASGWVTQSLPVICNVIPCVLDLHVVPRYDGCRDVGDGHCGEEEEPKEPEMLHEYRWSAGMCGFGGWRSSEATELTELTER